MENNILCFFVPIIDHKVERNIKALVDTSFNLQVLITVQRCDIIRLTVVDRQVGKILLPCISNEISQK